MFGQIDHTAEITTCAYFFGFQRTDKINGNYFLSVEKRRIFSARNMLNLPDLQEIKPFLSRRARLPWHAQKMCAVTIVGTVLKYLLELAVNSSLRIQCYIIIKNS